jgi:hypothetical protein
MKCNGFKNQFWIKVGELEIGFQSNGIEVLNGENINIYAKKRKYPAQIGPSIMGHVLIGCGVQVIHLNSSQRKVRYTLRSSSCMLCRILS